MTWWGGRVVLYACLTIASVLYVVGASIDSLQVILGWSRFVFMGCMGIGAAVCLAGSVSGRWVGEFIGLPLLASAVSVVAVALGIGWDGSWGRLSLTFILAGLVAIFVDRWREISQLAAVSRDQHENGGR